MKTTKLFDYRTKALIAEIPAKDFNKWCDANGYLPHHKVGSGWVVIK
jgi:hypothetical protein